MRAGDVVYAITNVCLFLTFTKFYDKLAPSTMFVPCLLAVMCLVIDRLCLGDKRTLGG